MAASPSDAKSKHTWKQMYIKLDEVSAKIIAFTDRSQASLQWSLHLMGADISTPFPGEPNYGINIDETPFCFYVRETTAGTDQVRFLAAPTDAEKKVWMKQLLQSARDGPISPRFALAKADNEFVFSARVVKFRTHDEGKHAVGAAPLLGDVIAIGIDLNWYLMRTLGQQEYMITCSCQLFSKVVARRLSKEWNVWHRFSEFDALNEYDAIAS